ncbi:unnamed protein product [Trichogramma brassicae]|uniref:Uncharacterized protein n=1 Tax=Trichogramma brassicae TaxID=86971 RepID=A0A6H5IXL1_9HYME|nr:unnamed protein product [Trichogramma brassicae]
MKTNFSPQKQRIFFLKYCSRVIQLSSWISGKSAVIHRQNLADVSSSCSRTSLKSTRIEKKSTWISGKSAVIAFFSDHDRSTWITNPRGFPRGYPCNYFQLGTNASVRIPTRGSKPNIASYGDCLMPERKQLSLRSGDHQAIIFEVTRSRPPRTPMSQSRSWSARTLDEEIFSAKISSVRLLTTLPERPEKMAVAPMAAVAETCDAAMTRKRGRRRCAPVYWWTEEIAGLRRRCL